jgi:hypothetical protein
MNRASGHLTIRISSAADQPALRGLADLGSCPRVDPGPHLLAEHDGTLVAALPLAGGHAIADPFMPTADIVALLEVRADQLRADAHRTRRRGIRSLIPSLGTG